MINRKTLGGLVVALILLGLLSWFTTQKRYATVEGGGFEDVLTEPIDASAVHSIRAWIGAAPDSAVELERSGDGWVVASSWGWPAKPALVDQLMTDLGELKGEKRSSSAEVLDDYQIDDEGGLHVVGEGAGGSELFHLVAGKTAPRGGSFVRANGSNDVYASRSSLWSSFGVWGEEPTNPDPKRWLNLQVHRATAVNVESVTIRDGQREIVLQKELAAPADTADSAAADPGREEWTWKPDAAGAFDKSKVDGIVSTLCNLYASDAVVPVEGEEDPYGLASPGRTVTLTLEDGTSTTIAFGNSREEDQKTYLRVGDDGLPALIYDSTVDRVFQERDALKPKES